MIVSFHSNFNLLFQGRHSWECSSGEEGVPKHYNQPEQKKKKNSRFFVSIRDKFFGSDAENGYGGFPPKYRNDYQWQSRKRRGNRGVSSSVSPERQFVFRNGKKCCRLCGQRIENKEGNKRQYSRSPSPEPKKKTSKRGNILLLNFIQKFKTNHSLTHQNL